VLEVAVSAHDSGHADCGCPDCSTRVLLEDQRREIAALDAELAACDGHGYLRNEIGLLNRRVRRYRWVWAQAAKDRAGWRERALRAVAERDALRAEVERLKAEMVTAVASVHNQDFMEARALRARLEKALSVLRVATEHIAHDDGCAAFHHTEDSCDCGSGPAFRQAIDYLSESWVFSGPPESPSLPEGEVR
jgi:hypothetical protein